MTSGMGDSSLGTQGLSQVKQERLSVRRMVVKCISPMSQAAQSALVGFSNRSGPGIFVPRKEGAMTRAFRRKHNQVLIVPCLTLLLFGSPHASAESVIRVRVYDFEPLISTPRDGKPQGLFIDILEYVAQKEGWRIEYVPGTWDECFR